MKKITVFKYGLNGQFLERYEREPTPEEICKADAREQERQRHEEWRQREILQGFNCALTCDQCNTIFGYESESGDSNGCTFMCLPCKEVQRARGTQS